MSSATVLGTPGLSTTAARLDEGAASRRASPSDVVTAPTPAPSIAPSVGTTATPTTRYVLFPPGPASSRRSPTWTPSWRAVTRPSASSSGPTGSRPATTFGARSPCTCSTPTMPTLVRPLRA